MTRSIAIAALGLCFSVSAQAHTIVVKGDKVATVGTYDYGPPMSNAVRSRELTVMSSGQVVEVDNYIYYPNGRIDSYDATCIITNLDAAKVSSLSTSVDKISKDEKIETERFPVADGGADIYSRYAWSRETGVQKQTIARTRSHGPGLLLPISTNARGAAMAAQQILQPLLKSTKPCRLEE